MNYDGVQYIVSLERMKNMIRGKWEIYFVN